MALPTGLVLALLGLHTLGVSLEQSFEESRQQYQKPSIRGGLRKIVMPWTLLQAGSVGAVSPLLLEVADGGLAGVIAYVLLLAMFFVAGHVFGRIIARVSSPARLGQ